MQQLQRLPADEREILFGLLATNYGLRSLIKCQEQDCDQELPQFVVDEH